MKLKLLIRGRPASASALAVQTDTAAALPRSRASSCAQHWGTWLPTTGAQASCRVDSIRQQLLALRPPWPSVASPSVSKAKASKAPYKSCRQ